MRYLRRCVATGRSLSPLARRRTAKRGAGGDAFCGYALVKRLQGNARAHLTLLRQASWGAAHSPRSRLCMPAYAAHVTLRGRLAATWRGNWRA